eukprot:8861155-Ditylum_brightwellii.AAC.1
MSLNKGNGSFSIKHQTHLTSSHRMLTHSPFPMMSKQVSSQQALQFGSWMMKDEELYRTVKKVFDDKKHLPSITRAFAARPQIACAIIENK